MSKISHKILNERAAQLSKNVDLFYDAIGKFNAADVSGNVDEIIKARDFVTKYDNEVKVGFNWFIYNGYSKAIEAWMIRFNPKGVKLLNNFMTSSSVPTGV